MNVKLNRKNIFHKILLISNVFFIVALLFSYVASLFSPSTFWIAAFFGLALPFLFFINLIFIIVWLFLGRKYFMLSLFALILGYKSIPKIIQFNVNKDVPENAYKIMSYNVRLFDLYQWQENKKSRSNIFKLIRREKADILCLQEFYYSEDTTYEFKTLDSISNFQNVNYIHTEYNYNKGLQHWGIATFSKYPIVGKGRVNFPSTEHNICIYTDIQLKDEIIRVYNMHLASIQLEKVDYKSDPDAAIDYFGKEKEWIAKLKTAFFKRAEQAESIALSIANSPYRVILVGDLNDSPNSYAYRTLSKDMKDAFVQAGRGFGQTYIGKFPSFRIDYILHSKTIKSHRFQTLEDKLSDHHPIVSQFTID